MQGQTIPVNLNIALHIIKAFFKNNLTKLSSCSRYFPSLPIVLCFKMYSIQFWQFMHMLNSCNQPTIHNSGIKGAWKLLVWANSTLTNNSKTNITSKEAGLGQRQGRSTVDLRNLTPHQITQKWCAKNNKTWKYAQATK